MLRLLLSLTLALTLPGPQAWAALAAVRVVPVGVVPVRIVAPAPAPLRSGSLLPSPSLLVPVLPSVTVLPGPVLPVMPAPAIMRPAAQAVLPASVPAALPAPRFSAPVAAVLEAVAQGVSSPKTSAPSSETTLRTVFDGSFLRAPGAAVAVPVTAASRTRPRLAPYLGGTFLQQAANNAVHVTLPLAVLASGGSLASAAVVVALAGWADTAGTMLGGWLADRGHPLTLIRAVTVGRVAALAAVPTVLATGGAAVFAVGAAFIADALARGVADTARNTLPVAYAGKDKGALEAFNARFQSYFEAGALAGPFLVGALLTAAGAAAGQWLAPAALAGAALLYMASPRPAMPAEASGGAARPGWGAVRTHLLAKPAALAAFVGLAALTLYPLRTVLPAVWAVDLLGDPASAAWLVGAFGAGGLAGSLLFRTAHSRLSPAGWVYGAVAGTAALALAWLPGSVVPLVAGVALFAASNVAARLSLTSVLQAGSPDGLAGGVMGVSRFTVNLTAMGVKAAAAAALAVAAGSLPALVLVAGGMAAFGAVQLWSARRLAAFPTPALNGILPPQSGPSTRLFDKDPADDAENIRDNYKREKRGAHFYFRNMLLPMQERFAQLVEHSSIPNVFLHGNAHVDNYAKTLRGASLGDFDRSRRGPYAWDLVRLMTSLSLRQKTPHHGLLPKGVLKALLKGYRRGFTHPERSWEPARGLASVTPEPWELTTNAYVAHGGKWFMELRESPLPNDDPRVLSLVAPYLDRYEVEEAGKGHGSMGFRDLVLVLLKPKGGGDRVLLNIKAVRSDPDTQWYKNPASNDGERMLQAGDLYAPGWEEGAGRAELDGAEYYVRRIPPQNAKLKKMLDRDQLEDFAYAVGTQLGRGHRLSVAGEPAVVLADLDARFDDYVGAALAMRDEVAAAHRRYLKALRRLEEGR